MQPASAFVDEYVAVASDVCQSLLASRWPLEKALRVAPRELQAKVHRAAALNFSALNRSQEAESHFREAVRLYRGGKQPDDDPRVDYGAFLLRQGRVAEALPWLRQAQAAGPHSSRANAELGRALLHAGDLHKAVASLERAIALDPQAWAVRLLLGRAYLEIGQLDDAERELRLGRQGWSERNADNSLK